MSTFHDPPASSSSAKTTSPSSTLHADFASQALSLALLAQSSTMADCEADQATPEPSAKILAQVSSTVGARLSTGDSQELAPTDSSLPEVANALLLLGSGASQTSTESIASGERERRPAASAASAEKASLAKVTSSTKTKRLDRKYRLAKCPICTDQNLAFPTHLTKQDPIACSLCGETFTREMLATSEMAPSQSGLSNDEVEKIFTRTLVTTNGGYTSSLSMAQYNYTPFHGVTIYECKLLSPLLSRYRLDFAGMSLESTPRPHDQPATIGLSLGELCTMDFRLESSLSDTPRYGQDMTGSVYYLRPTLDSILPENEQEDRLVSKCFASSLSL